MKKKIFDKFASAFKNESEFEEELEDEGLDLEFLEQDYFEEEF